MLIITAKRRCMGKETPERPNEDIVKPEIRDISDSQVLALHMPCSRIKILMLMYGFVMLW